MTKFEKFYHEFYTETQRCTKITQSLLKLGRPNLVNPDNLLSTINL